VEGGKNLQTRGWCTVDASLADRKISDRSGIGNNGKTHHPITVNISRYFWIWYYGGTAILSLEKRPQVSEGYGTGSHTYHEIQTSLKGSRSAPVCKPQLQPPRPYNQNLLLARGWEGGAIPSWLWKMWWCQRNCIKLVGGFCPQVSSANIVTAPVDDDKPVFVTSHSKNRTKIESPAR